MRCYFIIIEGRRKKFECIHYVSRFRESGMILLYYLLLFFVNYKRLALLLRGGKILRRLANGLNMLFNGLSTEVAREREREREYSMKGNSVNLSLDKVTRERTLLLCRNCIKRRGERIKCSRVDKDRLSILSGHNDGIYYGVF